MILQKWIVEMCPQDYIKPKSKAHEKQWLCECVCGRQKEILQSKKKKVLTKTAIDSSIN